MQYTFKIYQKNVQQNCDLNIMHFYCNVQNKTFCVWSKNTFFPSLSLTCNPRYHSHVEWILDVCRLQYTCLFIERGSSFLRNPIDKRTDKRRLSCIEA